MIEVDRLLKIHGERAGETPGRKRDVEVLNKSAIVLLTACWESFIEDMAQQGFESLLKHASSHKIIKTNVKKRTIEKLKKGKYGKDVWKLAGDGWRDMLRKTMEDQLEHFHNPSHKNIDKLFLDLFGLKLSGSWSWPGMSETLARGKLTRLIAIRQDIAHRVKTPTSVQKQQVKGFVNFINRAAVKSFSALRRKLAKLTNRSPWPPYVYPRRRR